MENVSLRGYVAKTIYGAGSKSEHTGLSLRSGNDLYYLRFPNQNPFETTEEHEDLIGKYVRVYGIADGAVVFTKHVELTPEE